MVVQKGERTETHFLNVDLDIHSTSDLQPLVSALGKKVHVLWVGRLKRTYYAHLEVMKITKDADQTIRVFCALVKELPRAERKLWNQARIREFNIGVQGAARPTSYEITLQEETVRAAAELGARIGLTIYGKLKTAPTSVRSSC
jgi:hypothetical protein